MYIIDVSTGLEEMNGSETDDIVSDIANICSAIYEQMDSFDTLWIFTPPHVRNPSIQFTSMQLCEAIQSESNYLLRNIVAVHRCTGHDNLLQGVYEEILLLVKDRDKYYFDKNPIRVEPVYEGKEWNGYRENGRSAYRDRITKRYNSAGKDPGNVWLTEIRTETNNNVLDRTEPFPRVEAIRRCVRLGSEEGDIVSTVWTPEEVVGIIESEDREAKSVQPTSDTTATTE